MTTNSYQRLSDSLNTKGSIYCRAMVMAQTELSAFTLLTFIRRSYLKWLSMRANSRLNQHPKLPDCELANKEVCGKVCVCVLVCVCVFPVLFFLNEHVWVCVRLGLGSWHSQHSTGIEAACSDSTFPLGWGMCTRNTTRTRVFFLPISVSPFRSSMSEFRSLRMPAQSILQGRGKIVGPIRHHRDGNHLRHI